MKTIHDNTLLKRHFSKALKVIMSCTTHAHIISANQMIINFNHYWGVKGTQYAEKLNLIYNLKKKQILSED
jgi:hypothetical protein